MGVMDAKTYQHYRYVECFGPESHLTLSGCRHDGVIEAPRDQGQRCIEPIFITPVKHLTLRIEQRKKPVALLAKVTNV